MERPLTQHVSPGRPPFDIKAYERVGGYRSVRTAIMQMAPGGVAGEVEEAGLRGRGGAGFPTAKKWSFMPSGDDAPGPRYLIANADEMEPGTFKDRLLMEGNPHALIEGMIVTAFAIQATAGFVFLRAEYSLCAERLERAIAEAVERGWLGRDILGSGFGFTLEVHRSAGRYICGEETALISALEGRRAVPRAKPPFPQQAGLWGKPTIVNNVETLCNVPHIVNRGAAWYRNLGRTGDGGTKIFGASGRVRRPGAWELPMGTPIRELIEVHAGGMREGHAFRGALPGGASTDFVVAEHLDTPMDFDSIERIGSRLGTGMLVVLDDRTCPVGMVRNLEHFFAQESCGWCTPCRDGLPYVEGLLAALEDGRGTARDVELLDWHVRMLGPPGRTFCAHATGAMEPLQSALRHFREDFDAHVETGRCRYREEARR